MNGKNCSAGTVLACGPGGGAFSLDFLPHQGNWGTFFSPGVGNLPRKGRGLMGTAGIDWCITQPRLAIGQKSAVFNLIIGTAMMIVRCIGYILIRAELFTPGRLRMVLGPFCVSDGFAMLHQEITEFGAGGHFSRDVFDRGRCCFFLWFSFGFCMTSPLPFKHYSFRQTYVKECNRLGGKCDVQTPSFADSIVVLYLFVKGWFCQQ